MNEMLANQLFMARKYEEALPLLEKTIAKTPNHKGAKRKLIICYAQTGQLKKSAVLFEELVNEDIQFIIDADAIHDDCPCPEIIEKLDDKELLNKKNFEEIVYLGILMLYCDYEKSLYLFERANKLSPNDELISHIFKMIQSYSLSRSA